jgi:nicotinamidase-related amidase
MAKALLVINMLNDFAREGGALYSPRIKALIPKIKEVCEIFKNRGERIIFLCDAHGEDDEEFKRFPPHTIRGTEGAEVVKELKEFIIYHSSIGKREKESSILEFIGELHKGKPLNVVEKTRFSGFFRTILERDTGERVLPPYFTEDEEVIVLGCCTDISVLYTVEELTNRDIPTIVIRNCVDTYDVDDETAKKLGIPPHHADELNEIFFDHMKNILGVNVVNSIEDVVKED